MKPLFLLSGLLALVFAASAQPIKQPPVRVADGTMFRQKVAVAPYGGQRYRLTMRAQADTAGGSWASLGIVYYKGGRYLADADLYNQKKPLNRVRSPRWTTYTIAGTLPVGTDTVHLNPNVHGNGRFAFDDFRLEVAQPGDTWVSVPLTNGDFEAPAPADSSATRLPPGWQPYEPRPVAGYTYRVARESAGNHYLLLRGTGIVSYGDNRAVGRYQMANGVRLYYETYGQGPPLLLLHGNSYSIGGFNYQIADLARHYRVIAVDTRDQGKSAITKGVLTYDLFAEDMVALLDALHVPAAHVVGWSDGGNTGLSMALHHPARVRSLVTMGANLYADTTAVEAGILDEIRENLRRGPARYRRITTLLLDYPRMKPAELAAIKAPVLVLAGEKDVIKEAHTRLIAASIPGAQVTILPGLSHFAPQEDPAVFNAAVLDFLAKH
ncbi:alpha/beta fold hydrolase [Hymenobacter sp. BT683]|uniref:Alpha/beta fold hydrolase n=1 Tax=Hymenobacter jeongseonensis TaxID=2791027 RepID=A0ABS0ILB7_9BACT|nr:alpha/beta hydrolase [Hymenobacter jeongseonensis]MBF9238565.1 alpha/beta fold hydrolase [Hymenobacter jeongseonensis]